MNEILSRVIPGLAFYVLASPILILFIGAIFALLVGVIRADPEEPNFPVLGVAVASALGAIVVPALVHVPPGGLQFLAGAFVFDSLTSLGFTVVALGLLITLVSASCTEVGRQLLRPELTTLLMLSAVGMMVMIAAGEFLSFFIGLEMASLAFYILIARQRGTKESLEAALKYFLMGAAASAVLLMGTALLYLHVGALDWHSFAQMRRVEGASFSFLGTILFVVGLCFKLGLVPFHVWVPDVYQGAHSLFSGFMAALLKVAVVISMLRILWGGVGGASAELVSVFSWLGVASMVIGSLYGLVQDNVKRILAYSSIANAGYFCLPFAVLASHPGDETALRAALAWAFIYGFLTLGAFVVISWIETELGENFWRTDLRGLGRRSPFAAVSFSVFVLGLAGVPPLAGFFGKFLLLGAAVRGEFIGLAIVMALTSVVSLFYYLSFLVPMWFETGEEPSARETSDAAERLRLKVVVASLLAIAIVTGLVGPRFVDSASMSSGPSQSVGGAPR